eukprot:223331-Hanusia_phi.AAC.1
MISYFTELSNQGRGRYYYDDYDDSPLNHHHEERYGPIPVDDSNRVSATPSRREEQKGTTILNPNSANARLPTVASQLEPTRRPQAASQNFGPGGSWARGPALSGGLSA